MNQHELKEYIIGLGVSDIGFCEVPDGVNGLGYAVSLVVRLSESIIDEIDNSPTHTYFNHYRTVNAFIDRALLQTGLKLQENGYRYITVAASQSINNGTDGFSGRYSHKKAARLAGLGTIGCNNLFIHSCFGSAVRLGTVFTDMPLSAEVCPDSLTNPCNGCNKCVIACPAGAIKGAVWSERIEREEMFEPQLCSDYMKSAFKDIGRGAVCGICIRECPYRFHG